MNVHPYAEIDPSDIRRNINNCLLHKQIASLAVPMIIRSRDAKTLIVGNEAEDRLKLPDIILNLYRHRYPQSDPVHSEIAEFFSFAFSSPPKISYDYIGLIRYKKEEYRVIAPALINLAIDASDDGMKRSKAWEHHARHNNDHLWLPDSAINVLANETTSLTTNTSTIVNYFLQQTQ